MQLILLGSEGKRKEYFLKAAAGYHVPAEWYPWEQLSQETVMNLRPAAVKIDPPVFNTKTFSEYCHLVKKYCDTLKRIEAAGKLRFLNTPAAICDTLDKRKAKEILKQKGIAVTPSVDRVFATYQELYNYLKEHQICQVFIKPNVGSGAAGVLAYRLHPQREGQILYTAFTRDTNSGMYRNVKAIRKITDAIEISDIINLVLAEDALVEKWVPKARFQKAVYDLRVLVQFGKVKYIIARGSGSPITNLHLNNRAIEVADLGLSRNKLKEIKKLAVDAAACFAGLNVAGIDILLTPEQKPYVIEVNGQGDLIYKDIYDRNEIYKEQVERMITYGE